MKILLIFAAALVILAVALSFPAGYRFSVVLCFTFAAVCALFYYFLTHPTQLNTILFQSILALLIVGAIAGSVTAGFILKAAHPSQTANCRYVVVLGAAVNGTVPSRSLRERIQAAYDYLSANPEAVAILTGGQGKGEDITEAACMYRELTDMGISPHRLYLEEKSASTIENLQFSVALMEETLGFTPGKVGIVSSEYHIFRAKLFAKSLGLEAEGIPARTGRLILRANYYLREVAAVWKYLVFGA